VELEVGCLGVCQRKGKERGIGDTPEADRWGCGAVWVRVHAWRVVERKERGGRGSEQDLACMAAVLLFSLFSLNFSNIAGAGVLLGVVLVNLLGMGARFSGKRDLLQNKGKEKKRKSYMK
jgi:hypothetical protein